MLAMSKHVELWRSSNSLERSRRSLILFAQPGKAEAIEHLGIIVEGGVTMCEEGRGANFCTSGNDGSVGEDEFLLGVALDGHCGGM